MAKKDKPLPLHVRKRKWKSLPGGWPSPLLVPFTSFLVNVPKVERKGQGWGAGLLLTQPDTLPLPWPLIAPKVSETPSHCPYHSVVPSVWKRRSRSNNDAAGLGWPSSYSNIKSQLVPLQYPPSELHVNLEEEHFLSPCYHMVGVPI